jgi:hypothetical protein
MKFAAVCLAALLAAAPAVAQDIPGNDAKPLSQILETVEAGGARIVYSADWHRRGWEVVSCPGRTRSCLEEVIDGTTGAVRRSESELVGILPPEGALPASRIAQLVEERGIGRITDLEFDDRRWEVEVREGIRRAEFRLDPMTGAFLRCEGTLCR